MESPPGPVEPKAPLAAPPRRDAIPANKLFPAWEMALKFGWIAGLLIAGVVVYRLLKPEAPKPEIASIHFAPASAWMSEEGLTLQPAISPDGNRVAFSSDRAGPGSLAIWTRPFDSGEPVRLTSGEFNESEPDFSPDGSEIAFRSERDGGGIYAVPASGGRQPWLVAKNGWRPKYSPDGKWIAFYTLTGLEESSTAFGAGKIFIVAPGGGEPRPIQPDFPYARYPVWSPDGQRLLFSGTSKDGARDWWLSPIDGGPATRMHALEPLNRSMRSAGFPEQWRDGSVYFSGAEERTAHVWTLPVPASTMRVEGPPRRLTDGKDSEQQSTVGRGGQMLYSSLHFDAEIWTLPIDANRAEVRGKLKAITNDGARAQLPSLSSDGSKMIYVSNRSGVRDVWIADPDGSGARAATSFLPIGFRPLLSPNGQRMVYPAMVSGKCTVIMEDLTGRGRPAPLEGCFEIWDWSPDGSELLTFQAGETRTVELRRIPSGGRTTALSHPTQGLMGVRFSPDGRWLAFSAGVSGPQARIFIAPFRGSQPAEREWIAVSPEATGGDPAWSPDGSVLYFHSKRDGYHCIWAQKLGPGKKPAGDPIAVQHLHATAFGMFFLRGNEFGLAISKDRLTMNLANGRGSIWKTTIEAAK